MPVNAPAEYFKATERFRFARTREEKIECLEEMIRVLPKHKGTEHLLAQLRSKLAKLRQQTKTKIARKSELIKKEGDAQVCLVGMTNSGKTTLLNRLTNANRKVSPLPYTTTKPNVGMLNLDGARVQLVEIPSTFKNTHMSIVHGCDGIILVVRNEQEKRQMREVLKEFRVDKPAIEVNSDDDVNVLRKKIWGMLGLIRIYTKEPGRKPEKDPVVMPAGTTVGELVKRLHTYFLKYFKFAKIWGNSAKYAGERVGLDHVLLDKDIVEVRIK